MADTVIISRVQHEALMAAAKALLYLWGECDASMDNDYNPHAMPYDQAMKALAALRAAGIQIGGVNETSP